MTDWIEHTTDTCPVDSETVVEVRCADGVTKGPGRAKCHPWDLQGTSVRITHYRIVTPAKPPEPEERFAPWDSWPKRSSEVLPSEPDLIALRLECLKLALQESSGTDHEHVADRFLHYVLNGSVDKA